MDLTPFALDPSGRAVPVLSPSSATHLRGEFDSGYAGAYMAASASPDSAVQYVRLKLVNPPTLTDSERALFEQLAAASRFDPRELMKG